jgi:DNA-binding CsgD family transcriptional regulator
LRPQERLGREVRRLARVRGLSDRETEILLLSCLGLDRNEIAVQMQIEPSTIKTLVRRLLRKMSSIDPNEAHPRDQRPRQPTLGELVSSIHRSVFLDPDG